MGMSELLASVNLFAMQPQFFTWCFRFFESF